MCLNNLPKVVTWQCLGSESNLRPQGYKFGMLSLHPYATQYKASMTSLATVDGSDETEDIF